MKIGFFGYYYAVRYRGASDEQPFAYRERPPHYFLFPDKHWDKYIYIPFVGWIQYI